MTSSTAEVRARLKAIHPADFSILCDRDYRLPENSDARLLLDATLEYYEELSKIDNEEEEDEDDKQDEEKEKEEEEKETKAQEEKERETKEWKEEEKDAWIQRRQDRKTKRIKLMRMKKMKRMKDKKDKRKGEICRVLGDCYLMQNDIDKAYAAYIRAMCLLPNPTIHWKLWYGAGIMYEHCGYADHAEAVFSPALSVDGPLSPSDDTTLKETLYRLGHPYIQQHKYDKSLVCFEKISRRGHLPFTSTKVDFLIGELYQEKGDYVNAQAAFERVLQESPRHTTAIRRLGWLYQQGGDRDRHVDLAIRHLQHAIDEDLTDAQSWYLLGRAYARTGEHEKALLAYSEAVKYDHDNLEFWCSIGEVYFDTRQYIRAIETYRYVLQVEPCTGEAWIDLGILYITTRQMLEAINAYKKAYDLKPSGRGVDVTRMLFMLRSIQVSGEALPPGVVDIQELRRVLARPRYYMAIVKYSTH
ncbi:TPR-like protein [Trametopsis cervina]|nr:TPR-like protein [Trametopsis cervina]